MDNKIKKTAFITGSSGFIGFHLAMIFLSNDWEVVGLDALTDYYDVNLKKARQKILCENSNFHDYEGLIQDVNLLNKIFLNHEPNIVVHLAAQAGVRYSIENPMSYVESNLLGTFQILEIARKYKPDHLLMASTSSVYGSNKDYPLHEKQKCDTPLSFYAATKKSNEVMTHSYSHIYNIPTTMFRFFTVYGPWGRPDMALFKFTDAILNNKAIEIYNFGKMKRDFTYIDDLVKAIIKLIKSAPSSVEKNKYLNDSLSDVAPWRVVNIGNSAPVNLMDYIEELEKCLAKKANKNLLEIQLGDVEATWADVKLLKQITNFKPETDIKTGIKKFVEWYLKYYDK